MAAIDYKAMFALFFRSILDTCGQGKRAIGMQKILFKFPVLIREIGTPTCYVLHSATMLFLGAVLMVRLEGSLENTYTCTSNKEENAFICFG